MKLLITSPELTPKTVKLTGGEVRLGRAEENDLSFPRDAMLSRNHLCFRSKHTLWFVSDCGSRNGTVFNGAPLTAEQELQPGDRIIAGHLTIEVEGDANRAGLRFERGDSAEGFSTIVTTLNEVLQGSTQQGSNAQPLGGRRVVDSLIKAGQELAVHRPLRELFSVILDLALEAVNAQRGVLLAYEKDQLSICASRGDGFAISTAVRDQVLKSKRSLVVNDVPSADAFRLQESIVSQQVRSLLAVPLQTGTGDVLGLLYVDNAANPKIFLQDDLELLTVMANIAAIRIEHARLASIEEQDKIMQAELEQAAEIQSNLLPGVAVSPPGYETAACHLPCRAIGGDYYDFIQYGSERLAIIVADVCGKGLPAALMMSSLQARVQMLTDSFPDPALALTLLNRSLTPRFPPGRFITAFYAMLEPGAGTLTYANAGHNHPILIRENGTIERLSEGGLVLALVAEVDYPTGKTQLLPGDTLCLFSDGVSEIAGNDGEHFGESRLAEYLAEHRAKPASEIVTALLAALRLWSAGPFGDDLTLVLVRRHLLASIY